MFAAQLRAFALAPMLSGAMSVFCAMLGRFLLTCNATNEPHAQDESVWCANHVIMLGVECLNQAMCLSCQSGTKKSALIGAHHTTGSVTITNKKHRRCPFELRLTHCGNDRLKIRQTLATTSNNIMGQACRHNKAELLQLSQQSNLKPVDR